MSWRCTECGTVLEDAAIVVEPDATDPVEVVHGPCDDARMERVLVPAFAPPGDLALTSLDHLVATCPLLRRQCRGQEPRAVSEVEPEGGGVCLWCRRVWRARTREERSDG